MNGTTSRSHYDQMDMKQNAYTHLDSRKQIIASLRSTPQFREKLWSGTQAIYSILG